MTTWAAITTKWNTETGKWDVITYTFTGTLSCLLELNSAKEMGIAVVGTHELVVEVNSPADFPQIILDGTLTLSATLESVIDYAIWVEEPRVTRTWTEETGS